MKRSAALILLFWCSFSKQATHKCILLFSCLFFVQSVLEACRCLGEIGPVDLAVLVLPSSETQVKLSSASKAIEALLTSAAENLLSMDIDLVAQTGQVLESLLQTTECMEVLDGRREDKILPLTKTNPTLAQILIPFQSESPGEGGKVLACNPSTLESQLSSLEVTEYMSYSKWVTQLTCGLIMALRPETSFLHRLLPLCRLKVKAELLSTFKNSFSVVINYIIATILGLILSGGFTVRDLRVFVGEQVQSDYTWPVVFLFS